MTRQIQSNILSKEHRAEVKSFLQKEYQKDLRELKILRGMGEDFNWYGSFKLNNKYYRVAGHFQNGNVIFEGEY